MAIRLCINSQSCLRMLSRLEVSHKVDNGADQLATHVFRTYSYLFGYLALLVMHVVNFRRAPSVCRRIIHQNAVLRSSL